MALYCMFIDNPTSTQNSSSFYNNQCSQIFVTKKEKKNSINWKQKQINIMSHELVTVFLANENMNLNL